MTPQAQIAAQLNFLLAWNNAGQSFTAEESAAQPNTLSGTGLTWALIGIQTGIAILQTYHNILAAQGKVGPVAAAAANVAFPALGQYFSALAAGV